MGIPVIPKIKGGEYYLDRQNPRCHRPEPANRCAFGRGDPNDPTPELHDSPRVLRSHTFVPAQRWDHIFSRSQRETERDRVFQRLSSALPGVRQHRMCSITEQCHWAGAPVINGITIEEFIQSEILRFGGVGNRPKLLIQGGSASLDNRMRLSGVGWHILGEQRHIPKTALVLARTIAA